MIREPEDTAKEKHNALESPRVRGGDLDSQGRRSRRRHEEHLPPEFPRLPEAGPGLRSQIAPLPAESGVRHVFLAFRTRAAAVHLELPAYYGVGCSFPSTLPLFRPSPSTMPGPAVYVVAVVATVVAGVAFHQVSSCRSHRLRSANPMLTPPSRAVRIRAPHRS